MEQFSPGDETAWETIKAWIDESDAFILILGGRYGSIEPVTGKSYVELEYEYASKQKKPFFALVVTPEHHEARVQELGLRVDERERPLEYRQFHARVTERLCRFWKDEKDIKVAIFQKLPEWDRKQELTGWVRGSEATDPATLDELARLSRDNHALRAFSNAHSFAGLGLEDMIRLLERRQVTGEEHQVLAKYIDCADGEAPANLLQFFNCAAPAIANFLEPQSWEDKRVLQGPLGNLVAIGLLKLEGNAYRLSDAGLRFRNKLLVERGF